MKSSTKFSLVAAAVAVAMGSNAFALVPNTHIDFTVYAGGGSAQTNAAFVAMTQSVLQPATVDSYTDAATGGDSSSYRVITGTTNAAGFTDAFGNTVPGNKNVMFFYKFNGGSFNNGVLPQVAATNKLNYPAVAVVNAATKITGAVYPKPTYLYTADTSNPQSPDWGISDVEVPLFNYTANLNGAAQLTPSQLTAVSQIGVYDNLVGVAVTQNLYAGTHPKTNFSKVEVEGILAGTLTNWNQLFADDGTQLAAGPIFLLDRGSGSGTKAGGNQYFLGYPGLGTAVNPGQQLPHSFTVGYNGGTVLNLAATTYQDVNEGSTTAVVNDLAAAQAAGKRAIGILGLEVTPASNQVAGANVYAFTKINGVGVDTGYDSLTTVSPITHQFHDNINDSHGNDSAAHPFGTSYTNVVNGSYDFFFQNSFNTRGAFLTGAGTNVGLANWVLTTFQSNSIAGANASKAFPLAVPGLELDPLTVGAQVAGVVLDSRSGNSAAPLQPIFDAASATTIVYGFDPL